MVLNSILVLLGAVIVIQSKCMNASSVYQVYKNYNEKFRNLAATSDYVYIGGNSMIIQLSPSLIYVDKKYVSIDGSTSKYPENWLVSTQTKESLIVCNFSPKFDTLCVKLNRDLSVVSNSSSLISNKSSTKYLTTTFQETNILIIASSTCLSTVAENKACNSISSFSVDTFLQRFQPYKGDRTYAVEYLRKTKHVTFKAILQIEKFTYFVFNTDSGHSKLGENVYRQERLKCPYNSGTANEYFKKQELTGWCFNQTTRQCQSDQGNHFCPELTDENDGFCNTTIFGSVEGTLPLNQDGIVYCGEIANSGVIVKLGILGFFTHSLMFAGTTAGKIGKIYVDKRRSEQLGIFKTVQHTFPVLDIKVHNQNVYVMTENTVINIDDNKPCPATVHCLECMKSENPACGWDVFPESCSFNPDNTAWWLPSVGRQCLQVTTKELVINETKDNIHLENTLIQFRIDPDINFYYVVCSNGFNKSRAARITNTYNYECVLPVGTVPFQLNVTIEIENVHSLLASTTVNVSKCSAFTSCSSCVHTNDCFWCLETVSCVRHAAACTPAGNLTITEDQCPRLTSTKVLIQASGSTILTENLKINVSNLNEYVKNMGKLRCVVGEKEYAVVVDNSNTFVHCQNVTAPGIGIRQLFLNYNGSRLDNSVEIEVFACMDFSSSCGICKHYNIEGYKCDWCGSCKTTIGGAPETCKQDQTEQCQLSVSGVYPSTGPEFGGTLINITGHNIVIEPSTVINCIICNGSASTQDGVVVTVNGVNSSLARQKYTFQNQIELSTFKPNTSILSGGRKISIQGTHIGFIGSRYNISFCNDIKCLVCRFLRVEGDHTCICKIDSSDSVNTFTYLTVTIDGTTHLTLNKEFLVVADPLVIPLSLDNATVFKSGGQKLTITGTGFSYVGIVIVDTPDSDSCTIISDNIVVCKAPTYSNLGSVFFVDDPLLEKLSKVYTYVHNAVLEIKGRGLLQGARPDEYLIRVGLDGLCVIIEINNHNITCLPPETKPRSNTGDLVFILVVVGNINEHVGYLRYESSTIENNKNIVLYGVAGGGIVGVLIIISVIVLMMRRSMKKKADKTNTEMKEIKEKISNMVTKEDVVGLSTGTANSRTEFVEPYDEVYDEINPEEESNSNSNRHTYLDVTSGYEELGQMSAINPYNQLHQTNDDRDQDVVKTDHLTSTQEVSNTDHLTTTREVANTDYLTKTQLYSNDFRKSDDYMEPVDTT
ncbi:PLXNA [Mytilus edulis]|uniref:PLXNA n=1 Tax=Mytilus edulis TaxID=6550 RepID=A0A8S3QUJ8_MYTED|nr:PLXNA [Mytilus edulis]